MMQTSAIPVPKPSDDEEVSWALSTAAALWTRGASADAVKWLRRAAQSANDLEDDGRAVELYKLAADLASSIPPPAPSSSSKAPASNVRPVAHALSTPPPAPAHFSTATHPSAPPRSSGVVATHAAGAAPAPAWTLGVTVRPSGAPPPPPTGRAALSSSIPPPSGRAAAPSVAPPASVRPSTLLPPPMPDAPMMAAPRSTPVPVIEMPTDTPLPAPRSAAPAAGPFQKTPSAPPPVAARALSEPPSPVSSPPAAYEDESELDLEVSSDEGLDALEAAPTEAADGFHARVLIIPTSRRGELRLVIVPPGSNPPPDTLTGVLVPSAQHADTIRALLYGAG